MTGMALLVCCSWAILLSLSVQAYGKAQFCHLMNQYQMLWMKMSGTIEVGKRDVVK